MAKPDSATLLPNAAAPAVANLEPSTPSASWWPSVAAWVSAAYVLGVVLMLLRLVRSIHRTERLRGKSQPITTGPLAQTLERLSRELAMRLRCTLASSCDVVVPTVVGFVKPTILLPASAVTGLSAGELEMILLHELAHVRRYDLWVNLLQRVAEVALFFNPALWYLSRRIGSLREYCCDEMTCRQVNATSEARLEYASTLLRVVELARPTVTCAELATLAATGRTPSELRRRVARLFGEPLTEPVRLSRGAMWLVGVAMLVGCGVFAQSQATAEDHDQIDNAAEADSDRPTLDELLTRFAAYENAHLPHYLTALKTIGMNEEASPEMREALPWGDGRLHQDLMEYVQGDAGKWMRKEISLIDHEVTSQAAWFCDGEVVTVVSHDNPGGDDAPRITEDATGVKTYSWAEPILGVLPLSMYSNGRRLTKAIELGETEVQLDWRGDDAQLRFSFGEPGIRSNFVVWLSAKHDWFPTRMQRIDADTDQLHSEWNATRLKKYKDSWRVIGSRTDYRGHPERKSDEPGYYVEIVVLEANYSDDLVQSLLDPNEPAHGVFLYATPDEEAIGRDIAEAEEQLQSSFEPSRPVPDAERIAYLEELVKSTREVLQLAESRFEQGQRPRSDVILAQYAVAVALAELAHEQGHAEVAVQRYTEASASAQENVEMLETAYKTGMVPLEDVLAAQRQRAEAKERLRRAQSALAEDKTNRVDKLKPSDFDEAAIKYQEGVVESCRKELAIVEMRVRAGESSLRDQVLAKGRLAVAQAELAQIQGDAEESAKFMAEAFAANQKNVEMLEQMHQAGGAVLEEEILQAKRELLEAQESLRLAKRALEADKENKSSQTEPKVPILCVDSQGNGVAGAEVYVFQHTGGDDGVYQQYGPFATNSEGSAECDPAVFTSDAGNYDRFYYARLPGKLVGVGRSATWKNQDPFNAEGKIEMRRSQALTGKVTVPEGFDPTKVRLSVRYLTVKTGPGEMDFKSFPRHYSFATLDTALPHLFERKPAPDGTFRIDDVPVEGRLTLVGEAEGLAEAQWHNRDTGNLKGPLELKCVAEGVLTGQIITPDGLPAADIEVAARIQASLNQSVGFLTTFRTVTDEEGRYELRGLPEWDLVVSIRDPQQRWIVCPSEPFFLSPGSREALDLQLEAGVTVSGRVTDPEGEPVKGVSIAALAENRTHHEVRRDSTKADGSYTLRLPSGTFGLHLGSMPPEFKRQEEARILTVRKNQQPTDDVNFTLQRKAEDTNLPAISYQDRSDTLKSLLDSMALLNGYGLAESQVVGRVAPPFAPLRGEWHRLDRNAEADSSLPTSMTFRWDGENLTRWSTTYGDTDNPGYTLKELMNALLRIKPPQMDGPDRLLNKRLPGDWVLRRGADRDEVVAQVETILREQFDMNVTLEFREVEREVYVVSGRYHYSPLEDEEAGQRRGASDPIQVFGTKSLPDQFVGNGLGDFDEFLNAVGDWIGMPIVNELNVPTGRRLTWRKYEQSPHNEENRRRDHDPVAVLRNVSHQTGLEFTKGKRKVELLFVVEE